MIGEEMILSDFFISQEVEKKDEKNETPAAGRNVFFTIFSVQAFLCTNS